MSYNKNKHLILNILGCWLKLSWISTVRLSVVWCSNVCKLIFTLTAVERIKEYLELPQVAPAKASYPPPAHWPSSVGGIAVQNLVIRYAPHLPPVLKNISFDIKPREKIGVVCL